MIIPYLAEKHRIICLCRVLSMNINKYKESLKIIDSSLTLSSCPCSLQSLLKSGEQCWSLAELVQAVVILAHCHSLCSFVFGCDTDSDFVPLSKSPNGTPPTFCPFDAANGNTNVPQSLATPSEHITRRRVKIRLLFCCHHFIFFRI